MCTGVDQCHFRNLPCHVTVAVLHKYWRWNKACPLWPERGHCNQSQSTEPVVYLFTLRKAVRLFSASALFWASSSNLRTKCNIFSNDRWQVDYSPPQEYSLSQRLQEGISWQKAFWINLLICCVVKRIFGSAPTGISCSSSRLMWHLCSSIRSCTQKGYAHTHL